MNAKKLTPSWWLNSDRKRKLTRYTTLLTTSKEPLIRKMAASELGLIAASSELNPEERENILNNLKESLIRDEKTQVKLAIIETLQKLGEQESGSVRAKVIAILLEVTRAKLYNSKIKWRSITAIESLEKPKNEKEFREKIVPLLKNADFRDYIEPELKSQSIDESGEPLPAFYSRTFKGFFVTFNVDWISTEKLLHDKGYKPFKSVTLPVLINLDLKKIFPIRGFAKTIQHSHDGLSVDESACAFKKCDVRIELETLSLCRQEIEFYCSDLSKKISEETLAPILNWVKESSLNNKTSFDLVTFKIIANLECYKNKQTTANSEKMRYKIAELIAEKVVFSDLYDAFLQSEKAAGKKSEMKESDSASKPIAKTSPLLAYVYRKWTLDLFGHVVEKNGRTEVGDKVKVCLIIKNKSNIELEMGRDFRLLVESPFFELDDEQELELNGTLKPDCYRVKYVTLKPIISEILKEEHSKYPIFFKLYEPINKNSLKKKTLTLHLEPPKITIKGKRPFLPYKGSNINIDLTVSLPQNLEDCEIPLCIKPCSSESDFKIISNSEGKTLRITDSGSTHIVLQANRAGFLGYSNHVDFEIFLGSWKEPFTHLPLDMSVLPNKLDTLIAGVTAIVVLFSSFYPSIVPPIGTELNPTTLGTTSAFIYLGFRALTWSWTTFKTK